MKMIQILILLLLAFMPLYSTKYAGEVFAISPGVLSTAMGGTGLTYSESFAAGWWNPALLAVNPDPGVELMRSQHFEGLLDQNQLSLILGKDNSTSLMINHLAIDDVKLTKLENPQDTLSNNNRPIVWKTVSNQDFVLYGGMARSLNDRLHLGLSPKLAYRSLASHGGYAFGADLGLLWEISQHARLGANLRDVLSTQVLWEGGEHEVVLPCLDLEMGYDLKALGKMPVHMALRSEWRAEDMESTVNFGSLGADLHAGLAVQPFPALKVLAGYDMDAITAGLGVKYKVFGLNYAFRSNSPEGLGYSQRVSASYQW